MTWSCCLHASTVVLLATVLQYRIASLMATPLRQRLTAAAAVASLEDDETNFDYQADVYDNRILDDYAAKLRHHAERTGAGVGVDRTMLPKPSNVLDAVPTRKLPASLGPPWPTARDLDETVLLKLLGAPFDRHLLSTIQPYESIWYPNGTMETNYKKGLPKDDLPPEIQHLQFALPPGGSASREESGETMRIKNSALRRVLRQYLWASSYCPVLYKWRDLGASYWPRWVNEGSCYNKRSCSIPAGMTCAPAERQTISLLFWHCKGGRRCKWVPIHDLPITTKCKCGC